MGILSENMSIRILILPGTISGKRSSSAYILSKDARRAEGACIGFLVGTFITFGLKHHEKEPKVEES